MSHYVSIEQMAQEAATTIAGWDRIDQKIALAAALEALEEYLQEAHPEMTEGQRGSLRNQLLQRVNAKLATSNIPRHRSRSSGHGFRPTG